MDAGVLYRAFTPDLEVRSGGDGRTIVGIAVPYGRTIDVPSERIREQFARGAFDHQLKAPHRVAFGREHIPLGGTLIGVTKLLRDDAAGLYGEWRASRTPMGDETLELVRDGALRHLSVGFKDRRSRMLPDAAGTITQRVKADLREVVVTMEGAYGELATVAGVRSAYDSAHNLDGLGDLDSAEVGTSRLDEARQILNRFRPLPLP